MKVFVFDLLAYGEQLERLKIGNELPYPLPKKYFSISSDLILLCRLTSSTPQATRISVGTGRK